MSSPNLEDPLEVEIANHFANDLEGAQMRAKEWNFKYAVSQPGGKRHRRQQERLLGDRQPPQQVDQAARSGPQGHPGCEADKGAAVGRPRQADLHEPVLFRLT